jgi:hypothetical protein
MIINIVNKLLDCKTSVFYEGFYAALDKAYTCNYLDDYSCIKEEQEDEFIINLHHNSENSHCPKGTNVLVSHLSQKLGDIEGFEYTICNLLPDEFEFEPIKFQSKHIYLPSFVSDNRNIPKKNCLILYGDEFKGFNLPLSIFSKRNFTDSDFIEVQNSTTDHELIGQEIPKYKKVICIGLDMQNEIFALDVCGAIQKSCLLISNLFHEIRYFLLFEEEYLKHISYDGRSIRKIFNVILSFISDEKLISKEYESNYSEIHAKLFVNKIHDKQDKKICLTKKSLEMPYGIKKQSNISSLLGDNFNIDINDTLFDNPYIFDLIIESFKDKEKHSKSFFNSLSSRIFTINGVLSNLIWTKVDVIYKNSIVYKTPVISIQPSDIVLYCDLLALELKYNKGTSWTIPLLYVLDRFSNITSNFTFSNAENKESFLTISFIDLMKCIPTEPTISNYDYDLSTIKNPYSLYGHLLLSLINNKQHDVKNTLKLLKDRFISILKTSSGNDVTFNKYVITYLICYLIKSDDRSTKIMKYIENNEPMVDSGKLLKIASYVKDKITLEPELRKEICSFIDILSYE